MDARQMVGLDGEGLQVDGAAVAALATSLGGELVTPDDPAYDDARRVWNGMIDRRPGLVARCADAADVQAAVRFARDTGVRLSVRGGGHNVAGYGTCDGGLVVDLSALRRVDVGPAGESVRAGAGATWADVDGRTEQYGRAVPGGIVSTTGVAGLTLGGGQGWLRRTYGVTAESLTAADVVTAGGESVRAAATENPELFWAIRGGGGNFGVVTAFEFRTHPVGPQIAFAGPAYPLESAGRVMDAVAAFASDASDEVNLSVTWWSIPPVDAFPSELHGRPVVIVGAVYVGDPEEGTEVLQPLRAIGSPLVDLSGTLPWTALQQLFDPFFPPRELRYYWKSLYLDEMGPDVVEALLRHHRARPSARSMIGVWALGGALGRAAPDAMAAGTCRAPWLVEVLANWDDPADDDANIGWARDLFDAMEAWGTGATNLNFPGLGEDPDFTRAALGSQWDRLRMAKRAFDPDNLFRLNQNVAP